MALAACFVMYPPLPVQDGSLPLAFTSTSVINSTDDRIAIVCKAPKTGSITHIAFRTGAVTAAETITVEVQTVNLTSAAPTGTLWATDTSGSQATPGADTVYEVTLTAAASVTVGDVFAVVFRCASGTPNLVIASMLQYSNASRFPYGAMNLTGSYSATSYRPMLGVRYGTDGYVAMDANLYICQAIQSTIIDTGTAATTGSRRGVRFSLPFGAELSGLATYGEYDGDFDLVLYSDAGTALATLSGNADPTPTVRIDQSQTNNWDTSGGGVFRFAPQTLSASTWYRLALVPTSTNDVKIHEWTFDATVGMGTLPLATTFYTTYYDGSNWQTSTTTRPHWSLLLTGIEIPSGSAGGGPLVGASALISA